MEKQGWISKVAHPENKRGFIICLTGQGKLMKKHMPQIIEKQMLKVLGGFDKKRNQILYQCWDHFALY